MFFFETQCTNDLTLTQWLDTSVLVVH